MTMLTQRFEEAMIYACRAHAGQTRKGTDKPYLLHVLGVASIALDHGATEEEAIGALLHDVAEDCGGEPRLADVRARFGDAVAEIVEQCSDTFESPKPPWKERKERYLEHLPQSSHSALLVSASDKLHNVRSIVDDLHAHGESTWKRFTGKKEGSLLYYASLVDAYEKLAVPPLLVQELKRAVDEMYKLADASR